jgi:hypothetical protein
MQKPNGFKALQLMHSLLLLGQIVVAVLAFFLIQFNTILPACTMYNKIIQAAILLYSGLVCYFGIQVFFKSKVYAIRDTDTTIIEKFAVYKKASMVKWACIESASIVSVIGYLLVGNYAFLALAFTLIFLFAIMGVSKTKLMLLLKFTEAEVAEINSN